MYIYNFVIIYIYIPYIYQKSVYIYTHTFLIDI